MEEIVPAYSFSSDSLADYYAKKEMKSPITDPQIVKDLMMMSYRYSPNEFRLLLHLVNKAYFQVLGNHSELGEAMQKLIDLRHTLASERVFSGTINKSNQGVIPRRSASRELYNR